MWHTDDHGGNNGSSDSYEPSEDEEEEETEVSSEETSMNQLDTSEEKLYSKCARDILFSDDGDTPSTSSEPPVTPGLSNKSGAPTCRPQYIHEVTSSMVINI
jgi:hypothetical protein